jgi:HK97 family phage portal protein
MVWDGYGDGRYESDILGTLPGSRYDYEAEAGDVTKNAAVSIALGWIGDNFPEPRIHVARPEPGGLGEPLRDHPLARLINHPSPFVDRDSLLAATAVSYSAHGNAYWYKARPRAGGPPLELWFVPHWQIRPVWRDEEEFVGGYLYRANGQEYVIPREDVVHFRFGVSEDNPREGVARLYPVLREVVSDNALSTYLCALLRNMGVPGVMFTPKDVQGRLYDDAIELMKREWKERYTGENAGRPFFATAAMVAERLGLSPADLNLEALRAVPEARICAALRLNPLVLGLTSGNSTRTFSNYAQARRQSYEDCLQPMQRRFAVALDEQPLPEWEGPDSGLETGWDYSRVAALQEERTEIFKQNTMAVRGGWLTVNQALQRAGFAPVQGQDVFLRQGRDG